MLAEVDQAYWFVNVTGANPEEPAEQFHPDSFHTFND